MRAVPAGDMHEAAIGRKSVIESAGWHSIGWWHNLKRSDRP